MLVTNKILTASTVADLSRVASEADHELLSMVSGTTLMHLEL